MADELLSAVIRLENQIQQQLQAEKQRATAWLATARKQLEAQQHQLEEKLAAEDERLLGEAKQAAEQQAAALLAREMNYCTRLEEISDKVLLEVLERQLVPRLVNPTD